MLCLKSDGELMVVFICFNRFRLNFPFLFVGTGFVPIESELMRISTAGASSNSNSLTRSRIAVTLSSYSVMD